MHQQYVHLPPPQYVQHPLPQSTLQQGYPQGPVSGPERGQGDPRQVRRPEHPLQHPLPQSTLQQGYPQGPVCGPERGQGDPRQVTRPEQWQATSQSIDRGQRIHPRQQRQTHSNKYVPPHRRQWQPRPTIETRTNGEGQAPNSTPPPTAPLIVDITDERNSPQPSPHSTTVGTGDQPSVPPTPDHVISEASTRPLRQQNPRNPTSGREEEYFLGRTSERVPPDIPGE
jgi:hypothetical protein